MTAASHVSRIGLAGALLLAAGAAGAQIPPPGQGTAAQQYQQTVQTQQLADQQRQAQVEQKLRDTNAQAVQRSEQSVRDQQRAQEEEQKQAQQQSLDGH